MQICLGGRPMKHPARSDFATVVTEASVSVTFKPTNSIYTFYRLTAGEAVTRLGPVAFAGVQHAGRNTEDYPADEVQANGAAHCFGTRRVPLVGSRPENGR